jgi:replication factor A1
MSQISEAQVKQWVHDELKRIIDMGLMYTEPTHPLDKTQCAIETAKQVGQTKDAFGENKPTTQTTITPPPETVLKRNLIAELQDGMKRINVTAQVVEKGESHKVHTQQGPTETAYVWIADESGRMKLSLWGDQVQQVKVGDNVTVGGGYVSSYKGELQLNVGKWGKLTVTGETKTQ